jgi:hypothetical protein
MKTTRKSVLEPKDRTYLLKNGKNPLTYFLASKDTPRTRLLYFDEEANTNRPLRYARNASSPFQDEQGENVIIEPIVFEDGVLMVPKTNPVLQEFLHYFVVISKLTICRHEILHAILSDHEHK